MAPNTADGFKALAAKVLDRDPVHDWGMLLNDQIGTAPAPVCCT